MSHTFRDFQNYPGRLLFYFFFLFENILGEKDFLCVRTSLLAHHYKARPLGIKK
jgi:hypothetical protein